MKINTMIAFAALLTLSALNAAEPVDPNRFEKEILVPAARDAIQMEVLPGGDVIFAEFWGTFKRWDAKSGGVSILGSVPTYAKGEIGLLGMAVARDFEQSGHVYALFAPTAKLGTVRVSRFTVKDGRMTAESELELLSWPYDTEHVFHMGGAMWMDGKGDLYIGNGDNCHYDPGLPQDTRPDRKNWDAFRSAANSPLESQVIRDQLQSLFVLINNIVSLSAAQVDGVNTLPPSSPANASVAVSGNTLHFTFDIPRGNDGSQGQPGNNGSDGGQGPQGAQGPPFAQAVVDGVTTLDPGQAATVQTSFDGSNVRFQFGIPRGNDGSNGSNGSNGSDGSQGPPGEISQAQLNSAINGTSNNTNAVSTLDTGFADPDMEALRQKVNEMILNGRR